MKCGKWVIIELIIDLLVAAVPGVSGFTGQRVEVDRQVVHQAQRCLHWTLADQGDKLCSPLDKLR